MGLAVVILSIFLAVFFMSTVALASAYIVNIANGGCNDCLAACQKWSKTKDPKDEEKCGECLLGIVTDVRKENAA